MSRFAIVTQNADLEQRVRQAVAGDLQTLRTGSLLVDAGQLLSQLMDADEVEVVVLGPDVAPAAALRLAGSFDEEYPGITVVLVGDLRPDVWTEAVQAGVRDVLAPSADVATIESVMQRSSLATLTRRRAMAMPAASSREIGQIVVVASPKGGSGKTTVATNLAVGLALRAPQSTVIVDLDVQFGDVATALGLTPDHFLTDAVAGVASHDSMVLKTFLTAHSTGLYALCGSDSPGEGDQVTGAQVAQLLGLLSRQFRYVVIDTASGLSEQTLAALDRATDAILLSSMDVPGVRGLRKEIAVLGELGLMPASVHLAMNFAEARAGLSIRDVTATIGRPIDIVIPRSRAVANSTNQGAPLLQGRTRDPAAVELRKLVNRVSPPPPAIKRVRRARAA